jgi:hypothetical protein
MVELREKALTAREKAQRARRVAKLTAGDSGRMFERQAAEFDAKAEHLEGQMEDLGRRL